MAIPAFGAASPLANLDSMRFVVRIDRAIRSHEPFCMRTTCIASRTFASSSHLSWFTRSTARGVGGFFQTFFA
jgi:hypothetical protein